MLKISRHNRVCPAIGSEVVVDCQYVEIGGRIAGPEQVIACNSKQLCKLVYEDERLVIKLNWQRCVFNT